MKKEFEVSLKNELKEKFLKGTSLVELSRNYGISLIDLAEIANREGWTFERDRQDEMLFSIRMREFRSILMKVLPETFLNLHLKFHNIIGKLLERVEQNVDLENPKNLYYLASSLEKTLNAFKGITPALKSNTVETPDVSSVQNKIVSRFENNEILDSNNQTEEADFYGISEGKSSEQ